MNMSSIGIADFKGGGGSAFKDYVNFVISSWYVSKRRENNVFARYILTSTKNASLIITDFLAMVYKNEQPRSASLCRG